MAVWDDTRVKPHVRAAAREASQTFGITNIGGFATSGHIPGSDHYVGLAIDIMCNIQQGGQVSAWAVANATRLGIKYVIWNRQIWYPGKGWGPYTGSSPHIDHVHISFNAVPGTGGPAVQGFGGSTGQEDGPMGCAQFVLKLLGL